MRYRIVIEVDTMATRLSINSLALDMKDLAGTGLYNPVYVATEIVSDKKRTIMVEKD